METQTLKNGLKDKVSGINPQRKEGPVAKAIESQTTRIPSDFFLWTGAAVMATSLTLKLLKKDHVALFIGQWAAPMLLFGIYNKIVKTHGHDQEDENPD
jgi:hypothetical protein